MSHLFRGIVASMLTMIAASAFAAAPPAASKPASDGKLNVAVMTLKSTSGISEG
jgi:hypothetical protein